MCYGSQRVTGERNAVNDTKAFSGVLAAPTVCGGADLSHAFI
jgi:hypothetical protein